MAHEVSGIRRGSCLGLLTAVCLCAFSFGGAPDGEDDDRTVARVNGTALSVDRFQTSYVQFLIGTGENDTRANRYRHLESLVDLYLLAEEARRRGYEEEPAYLAYADLQWRLAAGGRFYEVAFLDSVPPLSDAEIREAFRRDKAKTVVRHLFFREPGAAEAAYARLEAGEDFVDLANELYETAAYDSSAGYLGPVGYWELDDAFSEAAFSLPVGGYSKPVRSRYGWHIVRVDDRIVQPLLTESEYQTRREGIRQKARERRLRLEGDRFVRGYMEGLNVQVRAEVVGALAAAIRNATEAVDADATAPQRTVVSDDEVETLRNELAPETVLVTYEVDGERVAFTAADYLRWLPALPLGEARARTAASLGRAVRNEALARAGFELGLDADPAVQEEVAHLTSTFLAERLREDLRVSGSVEPSEDQLREAFERLGFRTLESARADYWVIPFPTYEAARTAAAAIREGTARPDTFEAFVRHAGRELDPAVELDDQVRRAPLETPVMTGTGDGGWYVIRVDGREQVYATFESRRDEIRRLLEAALPEIDLLRSLRARAEIEVDTLLFEEIMRLDG